jgi:hypothetical protein
MSLIDAYRQRRREISGPESVATLDHMRSFFSDGQNWAQHVYHGGDGGKCLVGAADHVRVSSIDDAKHWLRQAIGEQTGLTSIEKFNDKAGSFAEIDNILTRAKQLATTTTARLPAPAQHRPLPAPEIIPPMRAALPSPTGRPAPMVIEARPQPRAVPFRALRRSLFDWAE